MPKWEKIETDKNDKIYELTWFEKSNKSVLYKKWRVFLDQKMICPRGSNGTRNLMMTKIIH